MRSLITVSLKKYKMEYTVPKDGCEKDCNQLDEMVQHYKDLWIATTHLIHAIQINDKKKFNEYFNEVKILVHYPSHD